MQKVESDCPFKHFCELSVGFHLGYSLIINLYLISVTSDLTHFFNFGYDHILGKI